MGITRINNNISAVNAQRNIGIVGSNIQKSIERLSSGLRINRASDDAAGLAVANRLRTQTEGLNVAANNAQDGINLINVAEGALQETTNRLNRIRELTIQAANTGVSDFGARQSLQDEISQGLDEITRIANTTRFGSNFLLNGDFSIQTGLKGGQSDIGVNIDASPVASSLNGGTAFLNIRQTSAGFSQIIAGDAIGAQQILSTGINNQTDIAVSLARFSEVTAGLTAGAVESTDQVAGVAGNRSFFNGVSILNSDVITFNGVLADGVTTFTGTYSIAAGATFIFGTSADASAGATELIGAINYAIDQAERALFGVTSTNSVPTAYRTSVTLSAAADTQGRLLLVSSGNYINQSSINIGLVRGDDLVTQSNGVTRSGEIGLDSALSGSGKVGNAVTAITGSTFGTGQFTIEVQDVQSAQQRKTESTIVFRDANGTILSRSASLSNTQGSDTIVLNGTFTSGVYTGGQTLRNNDTISLTGTNSDGTTFQGVYTFVAAGATTEDRTLNDFEFHSISGLIAELNYRTRDYTVNTEDGDQTRFENAIFTFTSNGTLQLIDDLAQSNSQTSFTLTFNNRTAADSDIYTIQDDAELAQEGYAESATFSINGGSSVRAEAGDVVTLFGPESTVEGVPQSQVTFRVGSGLSAGSDKLETKAREFVGRLNGGAEVTFGAGEQDVVFTTKSSNTEAKRFVTVDFDSIIDVTSTDSASDTGSTILLSTQNSGLNFQIGAFSGQNIQFSIGDLKADNLGFGRGSGRTVSDINVSSLTGSNEALKIVDEALNQVNRTRSILGAATNRLQSTIANLSVASENLQASESRIRDADIATETSDFTLNQVLLQAGVSVLAQANFQSQGFLQLLG